MERGVSSDEQRGQSTIKRADVRMDVPTPGATRANGTKVGGKIGSKIGSKATYADMVKVRQDPVRVSRAHSNE